MQRVASNAVSSLPAPAAPQGPPGYFNQTTNPLNATIVTPDWCNNVTEEIIAVVVAGGLTPSVSVTNQMLTAIQQIIAQALLDAGLVSEGDISNFVTSAALASTLLGYVTNAQLTSTLANYERIADLTTLLLGYVTNAALTTKLAGYVTNPNLQSTLTNYPTNNQLNNIITSSLLPYSQINPVNVTSAQGTSIGANFNQTLTPGTFTVPCAGTVVANGWINLNQQSATGIATFLTVSGGNSGVINSADQTLLSQTHTVMSSVQARQIVTVTYQIREPNGVNPAVTATYACNYFFLPAA